MSQSSYIAAILLAGFVLFLAAKGRLTAYTAVLWGATSASDTSNAAPDTISQTGAALGLPSILTTPLNKLGLPSWLMSVIPE